MTDVELYIIKFSPDKQDRLFKIRDIMRERFFDACERIYYGIPTMEIDGKIVIQYAAYKKHISLLIGNILPAILKEKYPELAIRNIPRCFLIKSLFRKVL